MKPEHATKMVREAEITSPTGVLIYQSGIATSSRSKEKKFYTVTDCKLKQHYGKRLTTTVNTTVTKAQEQDISHVEPSQNQPNWVCCPGIMNFYPTIYPVCHNKYRCKKKIVKILGLGLYRAMLLKNCRLEMNINFHLEKQEQHLSVTAFPKIVGNFLSRGNFSIQGQH